jgi:hypothetical protein
MAVLHKRKARHDGRGIFDWNLDTFNRKPFIVPDARATTMATSEFWRDLAAQFKALPLECSVLYATRDYMVGSGRVGQWTLNGTRSAVAQFDPLARRGASELQNAKIPDLLIAWLEALMANEPLAFKQEPYVAIEENPDGSNGPQHMLGTLLHLRDASVNFCHTLESEALQRESEEKQTNDPKNWSPLRQDYEAFKTIKEIKAGPHEQISEAFVRSSLARHLRIEPEEITWKQITFAVSDLLRTYPAITLVPMQQAPSQRMSEVTPSPSAPGEPMHSASSEETIAAQLERLREECRWTIPALAEAVGIDSRTVDRHLAGKFIPYARTISAYERAFSKQLKRQVVIKKMP